MIIIIIIIIEMMDANCCLSFANLASKVPHVQFQRQSCEGQSELIRHLTVAERTEDKLEGVVFIRPQDKRTGNRKGRDLLRDQC